MKNVVILLRDLAIGLIYYFIGSIWFALSTKALYTAIAFAAWAFGVLVIAKVNYRPFEAVSVPDTIRAYWFVHPYHRNTKKAEHAMFRLGFVFFALSMVFFVPVWIVVKEADFIARYFWLAGGLMMIALFLHVRSAYLWIQTLIAK